MRNYKIIFLALILIGYIGLGVTTVTKADNKLKLKDIQLESKQSDLLQTELEFKQLNTNLKKELESKNIDQEKIKQLEIEKKQLQEREIELQKQVTIKQQQRANEQQRLAQAASKAVGTQKAYASGGSCEAEITKYSWNHTTALNVARAESGLRTNALNDNPATGDYSVGCFQINLYGSNARNRPSEAALKDASVNVAFAHKIYLGNGSSFLGQWGVCRKIACY